MQTLASTRTEHVLEVCDITYTNLTIGSQGSERRSDLIFHSKYSIAIVLGCSDSNDTIYVLGAHVK